MKSIAVVGCGQWGANLVRNFSQLGLLGGVCDDVQGRAEEWGKKYNVPVLTWQEVLASSQIQGIAIASPAPLHVSLALEGIEHQKHVFVEKPVALCVADMERLDKAAQEKGRVLMAGHLLRYHPAFLKVQALISEGALGEVCLIDAYRQSFGRLYPWEKNVFWSLGSHDISMILALTSALPLEVNARAESLYTEADQGIAHFIFDQKTVARLMVSWIAPSKDQRLVVTGTQATLVFNDTQAQKLTFYPHHLDKEGLLKKGSPSVVDYPNSEPLALECQHFWECITQGKAPRTDGKEALKVTRVLESIDENLQKTSIALF